MKRVYTLWSIFLMLCISSNQNKVYSEECGRIYTFDQTKRKPKSGVRKERLSFGDDTRKIIPIDRNNIVSEKVINLDRINDTIFRLSQNFPPHRYTDQSHSKTIMYDLIKAFTMNINTYKHYSPEIPYFIISFFSFEMKENNIFPSYWDYIIAYHLVVYKKELEEAGHIVKELLSDKTVWFNKTIRNLEVGEEELLLISSRIHTVLQEIANNNLKQANKYKTCHATRVQKGTVTFH